MAYNEQLAQSVRGLLPCAKVEEKKMMGGLTFMVNGKMCVGVLKDDLMVRLDPDRHASPTGRAIGLFALATKITDRTLR